MKTISDIGSRAMSVYRLHDCQVDVVCLPEVKLDGIGNSRGYYSFYHNGPEAAGQQEVAVGLSHRANFALLSWQPISLKIVVGKLKCQPSSDCYPRSNPPL